MKGSDKMRILGIGAHPDDLEINCGGTLAKYYQLGHSVVMAFACSGDKGHFRISPEELAHMRKQEAKRAAQIIEAESIWLGFHDGEIEGESLKNRETFIELIRRVQPDIIFTHSPLDYHADHIAVSRLVVDAVFMSTVPHIKTEHPAVPNLPQIYYIEPYGGIQFQPDAYVDIETSYSMKVEMLSKHQSQVDWLREHDGIDILERLKICALYRGLQCGKTYAEGFVRHQASLRGLTERLLP